MAVDAFARTLAQTALTNTTAPTSDTVTMYNGATLTDTVKSLRLPSVTGLLSSTLPAQGVGSLWFAGSYSYTEASPSATDNDVITAGGVKLYVNTVNGSIPFIAFGPDTTGTTPCGPLLQKAVSTGKNVFIGAGTFNLAGTSIQVSGTTPQKIHGAGATSVISFTGTSAFYTRPANGMTGSAMFSTFATNLTFQGLNFVGPSPSNSYTAIKATNVRGLWVEDCLYKNCRFVFVNMEVEENGTYVTTGGSVTVDPAVTAGFSATDPTDLNEGIYIRRNKSLNTVYGIQGVRINWARYGEISGNDFAYGNISWWGGGAGPSTGGQQGMLRRFRHFRIHGNYCSWNNGGIYGNNGESVTVSGNILEYSTDTALDFEGCIDCVGIGNTIRHFGNYGCSTFYVAKNILFSGNTIECTVKGASIAAEQMEMNYFQTTAITGFADSGDGGTNITTTLAPDIVSGQRVLIQTSVGGAWNLVTVTKVSSLVYRVSLPFSGGYTPGGSIAFQRGRTYFCCTSGLGVTTDGQVRGEVVFDGNVVGCYDGLYGITQDTQNSLIAITNNKLTNCRVFLTYGTGERKIVTGNIFRFQYGIGSYSSGYAASVPQAEDYTVVSVAGYTKATISRNYFDFLNNGVWVPSGTYLINLTTNRTSNGQISIAVENNRVTTVNNTNVSDGLYHSSQNVITGVGAAGRIVDNYLHSFVEASPAGLCKTLYNGNGLANAGLNADKASTVPVASGTFTMLPNHRYLYLMNSGTITGFTITLPIDPTDDVIYRVTAKGAVNSVTFTNVSTGSPSIIGTVPTNISAGSSTTFRYSATMNAWIFG